MPSVGAGTANEVLPLCSQFQTSYGRRKRNPDWKGSVEITPPSRLPGGGPQHSAHRARRPGFSPRAWVEPGSFPRSPDSWVGLPSLNLYCRAFCLAKSTGDVRLPLPASFQEGEKRCMSEAGSRFSLHLCQEYVSRLSQGNSDGDAGTGRQRDGTGGPAST